jgi:hypothetical protein
MFMRNTIQTSRARDYLGPDPFNADYTMYLILIQTMLGKRKLLSIAHEKDYDGWHLIL